MENNPYESAQANLQSDIQQSVSPVSPWAVTGFMFLVSIAFGLIIAAVEAVIGRSIPGLSFISTALPAYAAGTYFARKHGLYMPKRTRILSVVFMFLISLLITLPVLYFLDVMSMVGSLGMIFWIILLVILPLLFAVSYYCIYLGEKMVLEKK